MKINITWVAGAFILGSILGFNFGTGQYSNLWDMDRNGLKDLNNYMADDDTQRLGIAIITEQQTYTTQSVDSEKWQMKAGFFQKT